MSIVYLDGRYVPADRAVVSVDDRGFLFGDACYEATPVYRGRCFLLDEHLARLQEGLDTIRVRFDAETLRHVHAELIHRNGAAAHDLARVYVQVTRGVAPRVHQFPGDDVRPTVYVQVSAVTRATDADFRRGVAAITHPDQRWSLPRIKTTGLLANVLARQAAADAGAVDVVMHRDGFATEGAHNNLFVVRSGRLVTPPADDQILNGVTRRVVIDEARAAGIAVDERSIPLSEVFDADEVFFTGTTTEVRATTSLDGNVIGTGGAGPVTTRVRDLYLAAIRRRCGPSEADAGAGTLSS